MPKHIEPMLRDTLKDFVVLPHRDKYGRRIVVFKMWNANKWPYKKGMEAFYVIMLLLSREPKTQIAGITMLGDYSGMSRKHMATNIEDIRAWANLITVIENWIFLAASTRSARVAFITTFLLLLLFNRLNW
jgi:hypothetical protein